MKGYRTIIVAVVSVIASFFPVVQDWIAANPEGYATLIGAVMVLLRIVTTGKVANKAATAPRNGKLPSVLPIFLALGAVAGSLSSCAQMEQGWDKVRSASDGLSARIGTDGSGAVVEVTVPPGVGVGAKLYAVTPLNSKLPKPAPELPVLETYPPAK